MVERQEIAPSRFIVIIMAKFLSLPEARVLSSMN